MALLHGAELRPSKIELVTGWAPNQPWFEASAGAELASVASFRFDDPAGEVGIETLLVRAGDGPVMQVPLTYRGHRSTEATRGSSAPCSTRCWASGGRTTAPGTPRT